MKSILITGCSSGFGYDATKYLASKGHHIYATMRDIDGRNSESANNLRQFARDNDFTIDVLEMDVCSDESVSAAVSQIPIVDVLINNAGSGFGGPVEAFSSQKKGMKVLGIRTTLMYQY